MLTNRLYRALSAFDPSIHRWAAIPLRNGEDLAIQRLSLPPVVDKQRLSLVSWNINAFTWLPVARSKLILDHILKGPTSPDIIMLQEVTSGVRESLLNDTRVRSNFLTTDAEDETSFDNVSFATMTLLSSARFATNPDPQLGGKVMLECVSRLKLPSNYKRDGLCVDIVDPAAPGTVWRLINVHLDSLNSPPWRPTQMKVLSGVLREDGCRGGIIAGDFNAINSEDHELVGKNKLVDAWVALHGENGPDGATWGVGMKLKKGLKPGRLDKAVMLGSKAESMEILHPGVIAVSRPGEPPIYKPWSDHCGLQCIFTI